MHRSIYTFLACLSIFFAQAQLKVGNRNSPINDGAVLDLESNSKGLLYPRIALGATTAVWGLVGTPIAGMAVYNTKPDIVGSSSYPIASGGTGLYYWDGAGWVAMKMSGGSGTSWGLNGNAGISTGTNILGSPVDGNYIGTPDAQNLVFATNGIKRVIFDQQGSIYAGVGSVQGVDGSLIMGIGNTINKNGITDPTFNGNVAMFGNLNEFKFSTTLDGTGLAGGLIVGRENSAAGSNNILFGYKNLVDEDPRNGYHDQNLVSGASNRVMGDNGNNAVLGSLNTIDGETEQYGCFNNLVAGAHNKVSGWSNIIAGGYSDASGNTIEHGNTNAVFGDFNYCGNSSNSLVAGLGNVNYNNWSTVVGRNNMPIINALFTVGNGDWVAQSNAFVITNNHTTGATANGLVVLIPSLPSYASTGDADADGSLPAGGLYKIGHTVMIK